jgi:hypothetical protein
MNREVTGWRCRLLEAIDEGGDMRQTTLDTYFGWRQRWRRWLLVLGLMGWLWLGGGYLSPASASILRTADTADAIVVQSRRTLWDAKHHSWQVIAFKRVQPGVAETIQLRLVAFPNRGKIAHPQPLRLSDIQEQAWLLDDRSDQISVMATTLDTVGQYDLEAVLAQLPTQRLRLEIPIVDHDPIGLRIAPSLIQEWQAVAQTEASQLIDTCDQFPLEARHNPAFPAWTHCRID